MLVFEIASFGTWYCPQLNKTYYFLKVYTPNIVTEHVHQKLLNASHVNCSLIVSIFAIPSRHLGIPTTLNQLRFVWHFFLEKFFSISKSVCPKFSKKSSLIFNNKDFHNLIKKMFYQTQKTCFSSLQSDFCVGQILCQYNEIYATWSSSKLRTFLEKLTNYTLF